jgi:hypothetical protein
MVILRPGEWLLCCAGSGGQSAFAAPDAAQRVRVDLRLFENAEVVCTVTA